MINRKKKILIAMIFSFLVPGLGQVYNGQLRKGIILYTCLCLISYTFKTIDICSSFTGIIIFIVVAVCLLSIILFDAFHNAILLNNVESKRYQKWYFYVSVILINIILTTNPSIQSKLNPYDSYKIYKINSDSMQPNLIKGERIIVKANIMDEDLQRGDVIVFNYPLNKSIALIKRIVGLPNESIAINDGITFINNKKLDEPYVLLSGRDNSWTPKNSIILPSRCYFVMGDNRIQSLDSSLFGCIDVTAIQARGIYVLWSNNPDRIGKEIK